jgi:hypothetical protein
LESVGRVGQKGQVDRRSRLEARSAEGERQALWQGAEINKPGRGQHDGLRKRQSLAMSDPEIKVIRTVAIGRIVMEGSCYVSIK